MMELILRYFYDNHKETRPQWLYPASKLHFMLFSIDFVGNLLLYDTKQEEDAALSKQKGLKKRSISCNGRWLQK